MSLLLIGSERFGDHMTPPGHVERVERAHVFNAVAIEWRRAGGTVAAPRPATRDELLAVHSVEYCDAIASTAGRAVMLDPDTFTSPDSHEVALLAAGAACAGVEHALGREAAADRATGNRATGNRAAGDPAAAAGRAALALVRPPGHHAERDRAMGFCLYSNVAIGAAAALARGCERVAIVDFDVHHGNGTQWAFYADPRVLFISLHQYPFWPGTGAATEAGRGEGAGFTVNVPLAAGAGDADYDLVFREIVSPLLTEFSPELLFVSAGFDAHHRDPLAGMRVTTMGYRRMMESLWRSAADVAGGRMVVVTEGGYDLQALGEGLDQVVQTLAAPAPPAAATVSAGPEEAGTTRAEGAPARGLAAVQAARAVHRAYWPTL